MPPKQAPVDKVGGPQDRGPWPVEVDEITTGKAYRRPVPTDAGPPVEVVAQITGINDILADDGQPTGGKIVRMQFEDPRGD